VFAAGAIAVGLLLLPAAASAATPGNWWVDWYGVPAAQSAGADGAGVKVAVVDGQIDSALPVFQGADLTVHEPQVCGGEPAATTEPNAASIHGSDMTALLIGNGTGTGGVTGIVPKARVTFYGTGIGEFSDQGCTSKIDGVQYSEIGLGIRQAVADGNRIVSVSLTADSAYPGDVAAIAQAVAAGVVVVTGDSNTPSRPSVFPARLNGVVTTNAFDQSGDLQKDASGQPIVWHDTTVVGAGAHFASQGDREKLSWGGDVTASGSSNSTALVAGMLAATLQKYPKATGDQLIQSLIHNTTADDHALKLEPDSGFGYGPASLAHLLRVDPTRYPDRNPLMQKAGGTGQPTQADVDKAKGSSGSTTSTSPAGSGSGSSGGGGALVPVLVTVGVVLLIAVIAVVVLVIVVLARRGRPRRGELG